MAKLIFLVILLIAAFFVNSDENVVHEPLEKVAYTTPSFIDSDLHFVETFDDKDEFLQTWVKSEAKKDTTDDAVSKYEGEWELGSAQRDALPGDLGLILKSKAKLAAISAKLKKPFIFFDRQFIVQYEVLLQDGQECGGSYLKLLSADQRSSDLRKFNDKTPYTIMFGPDKCGNDHKLHFIFRHKSPKNGSFEEKHCKKPTERIDENFTDRKPHLYRLIINPDNTFEIFVDHNLVNSGSLLEHFTPPVNPPAEIDDPVDKKPSDWDDREKIPDSSATKPDDWIENAPSVISDPTATKPEGWLDNEPLHIHDPFAEKPDDWDEELDGEWEAPLVSNPACEEAPGCGSWTPPMIPNPDYKGKWVPPLIDNPNYKGKWAPRRIPNPDYFEDKNPFKMTTIGAVGFELWSMSPNILFDNIIITDRVEAADKLALQTFDLKKKLMEIDADTYLNRFVNFTNKYPWLWAVYIVLLLIPITLIVVCCFGAKERDQHLLEAQKKKDDDLVVEGEDAPNSDEPVVGDARLLGQGDSPNQYENEVEENVPDSRNEGENEVEESSLLWPDDIQTVSSNDLATEVSSFLSSEVSSCMMDNALDKDEDNENSSSESAQDSTVRKRCQRID